MLVSFWEASLGAVVKTCKHLTRSEEGSYTMRSPPFRRLPSAPAAHLSASHWMSQPCLWSVEMTDNNTNTLQDATCDSPPAVWLGQREAHKERADKNTVLPGHKESPLQKKERSCRSVRKTTVVVRPTLPEAFGKQDDFWSKPARMKRTCKREPEPALAWAKGCCLWKRKKSCVNAMWKGLEQKGLPYSPQLHSPITVTTGKQSVLRLILPEISAHDLDKEFQLSLLYSQMNSVMWISLQDPIKKQTIL